MPCSRPIMPSHREYPCSEVQIKCVVERNLLVTFRSMFFYHKHVKTLIKSGNFYSTTPVFRVIIVMHAHFNRIFRPEKETL